MNFLKRCWQRRWIRGLVWTAVTLVTLYALLCAWVNWSGARQWSATQAMLKAEGETLDFRATINEPIPESENFCAIPLLKDLALAVDNDSNKGAPAEKRKKLESIKLPWRRKGQNPKLTNAALGNRANLSAWADMLRTDSSLPVASGDAARDLLGALAKDDPLVHELASGLSRRKAQWTPEWKTCELPQNLAVISLPHYEIVQAVNRSLALRATGAARAGEAAKAHETALIIARLSQASLNDPFLIGLLVAASGAGVLCGATWEFCDAHAGTVEDFIKLEAALMRLDFYRGMLHAWRSEMALGVNMLQNMKRSPATILEYVATGWGWDLLKNSALGDFIMGAIPSGFYNASAAVLADRQFKYLLKPLRDQGWQPARQASRDLEKELSEMNKHVWTNPSYMLTASIGPVFTNQIDRAIYTQVLVNQAVIACALERHLLEKGAYPDSLDSIRLADGKPLPVDAVNGKPMNYRQTADGRYALWSVGVDGEDDEGKRVLDEKKPESTKFNDEKYVGDWVWDFPEN